MASCLVLLAAQATLYGHDAQFSPEDTVNSPVFVVGLAAIVWLMATIASWIWFLSWVYGMVDDLRRLVPRSLLRISPWRAVGGFFLPFYCLYHAFKVLSILRARTDPEQLPSGMPLEVNPQAGYRDQALQAARAAPPPGVVAGAWALAWAGSSVIWIARNDETVGRIASVLSLAFSMISTGLLISILLSLDTRLNELHRRARSASAGEPLPAAKDERPLAAAALASASAVLLPAAAWMLIHASQSRVASWSIVLPFAIAGWLLEGAFKRWEKQVRRWMPVPLLAMTALLAVGVLSERASLDAKDHASKDAQETYEALDKVIEEIGADREMTPEAARLRLAGRLASLERIADANSTSDTNVFRCMGRHEAAISLAKIARRAGERAEQAAATNAKKAEAFASLRQAWTDLAEQSGKAGYDRAIGCMKSYGVAPSEIRSYEEKKEKIDEKDTRLAAANASLYSARVEWVKAQPDSRPDRDDDKANLALAEVDDRLIDAYGAHQKVVREVQNPQRSFHELPGGEARRAHKTALALEADRQPLPDAPAGMKRVSYRGPLGLMAAYSTPEKKTSGPALLWVPSSSKIENELAMLAGLTSTDATIFLPTVRGMGANPGQNELNYGEIDDLSAALSSLASRSDVNSNQILIVGLNNGGTRALLLASSIGVRRGVWAIEPTLEQPLVRGLAALTKQEAELRSPFRFLPAIKAPTFLLASGDELLDAKEFEYFAGLKTVPAHAVKLPLGRFNSEALLRLLSAKLAEHGELTLTDEDVTKAIQKKP